VFFSPLKRPVNPQVSKKLNWDFFGCWRSLEMTRCCNAREKAAAPL
jgi:hypothetical protein